MKVQRRSYREQIKLGENLLNKQPTDAHIHWHTCDLLKVLPTTSGCKRENIILSPWPNIYFANYLMFYKLGIIFSKKGKASEISAPSLNRLTKVNLDSSKWILETSSTLQTPMP